MAADETALALGLRPGQTLADAMALESRLVIADADPDEDRRALEALADWCVRFSPAVALDAPDGLVLEVDGSVGLWPSEQALLDDLILRFARAGVPAKAAIASTIGAAWAFARWGEERVYAETEIASALARLPIEALRLDAGAADDLVKLGLTAVGQLAAMPRAALARRFGAGVRLRLDQALGEAEEALSYRRPPAPFCARLSFVEPISAPEDLQRVATDITAVLSAKLAMAGKGARRFTLTFHRVDGRAETRTVGTALPSRDVKRIAKLFLPKLETVDPGFGIEAATLIADRVDVLVERQIGLSDDRDPDALGEGPEALIDRLTNRLGEDRVWRPSPVESWLPERAVERAPPLAAPAEKAWPSHRPRPIRLFRRPEPIDAIAPVPDDPPVRFTWRGRTHSVSRAEGPERLAQEWWRKPSDPGRADPGRIRDYYRVEDAEGRRFWIFRLGLYAPETPPRWFMHGLFA
jgi:protein ImuB